MEKEREKSNKIENVVALIILHDTVCLDCGKTGTVVKRPEYCIGCKGKNLEIKERKFDAIGWIQI